ncbi:MAG: phosphotransferase enzyme family protein [Pseudonocardiaceae bacterium]
MTDTGPDLEGLCQEVLGEWRLLARHTTRRAGGEVLHVRNARGEEFAAKRHLNQRKHRREVHAYAHWVPNLAERAPRMVAADPTVPGILITAVPGQPAHRDGAGPSVMPDKEAGIHRQAGKLLQRLHSAEPGRSSPDPLSALGARLAQWLPDAWRLLTSEDIDLVSRCTADLAVADRLPLVPCHLDYQPRNWMIDVAGDLRVIDFEHARLDIAIRDLVRLEFRHWTERPDLREAFLDGYGRSLDDNERALLKACAAIDAVTAVVRGHARDDPVLTSQGRATLLRLRDQSETVNCRPPTQSARLAQHARVSPLPISRQLESPDIVGRDLALFRTRAYRFSDDPRHYVMAEWFEESFLTGSLPSPATLRYVRTGLAQLRADGRMPAFDPAVAEAEGLDAEVEIARRADYRYAMALSPREPELIVAIVGAPRSGTSHLVNVLARQQLFAYFTAASCWAWPVWNLLQVNRHLFTEVGDAVFAVDNKRTRTIPGLVMPAEAEDVYARAIPVYRHLAGHRYHIDPTGQGDLDVLCGGINAHLDYFNTQRFLTKSPFNSFRIPALENMWGTKVRYIHIVRDQSDSADSMMRNNFEYVVNGRLLSSIGLVSTGIVPDGHFP